MTFAHFAERRRLGIGYIYFASALQPESTSPTEALRRSDVKNPLDSLWGTIISGVILTAVLYFAVKSILG